MAREVNYFEFPLVEAIVTPFVGSFETPDAEAYKTYIEGRTDIIPYGSCSMMRRLGAQNVAWKGLMSDPKIMNMENYLANRQDMLNSDASIVPLSGVREELSRRAEIYGEQEWFVRPNQDLKSFKGEIIYARDVHSFCDALEKNVEPLYPDSGAFISTPKKIDWEWRFFVIGGRVITGSTYKIGDRLKQENVDHNGFLRQVAQSFARRWLPYPCVAMDLCFSDDKFHVVEFNSINASGVYACSTENIVLEMSKYVDSI